MKLSYAICVCDEAFELRNLLAFLVEVKDPEDEINVLVDTGRVTDKVRKVLGKYKSEIVVHEREFCGNFSTHRNYHNSLCTGDYIFVIDADEIPMETLVRNVKTMITESKSELIYVPRLNICPGYTQKWNTNKHGFNINENGWINWPDHQGRIYKNSSQIEWANGVHETVTGAEGVVALQPNPQLALWHVKTVERQDRQHDFYEKL
jgi:hypothetical protein